MAKRMVNIVVWVIIIFILAFWGIFDHDRQLRRLEDWRPPERISSYDNDTGMFKIDPSTVIQSIQLQNINALTPLPADTNLQDLVGFNGSIYWTQTDFLKISSLVSKAVWGDSMNFDDWQLYSFNLEGDCEDRIDFYGARFVFFKTQNNHYTTRLIEIYPRSSLVVWAGENLYGIPILKKWSGIDLLETKVSVDDAFQMIVEDAKKSFRYKEGDCNVHMFPLLYKGSKILEIYFTHLGKYSCCIDYIINSETGNLFLLTEDNITKFQYMH